VVLFIAGFSLPNVLGWHTSLLNKEMLSFAGSFLKIIRKINLIMITYQHSFAENLRDDCIGIKPLSLSICKNNERQDYNQSSSVTKNKRESKKWVQSF
jgi:hypothetical protein